jgi:hypothetical protein
LQNWKYIKIFGGLPPCWPLPSELADLLGVLSAFRAGEVSLPAGYTYLGQFIDHDLSFLLENGAFPDLGTIAEPVDLDTLTLARKPALDLDSVYGGGFSDSVIPFDKANGKFILGDAAFARNRDFSRDTTFRPRIGDPRNDENLLVAQIQILFMSLHNKIVQDCSVPHGLAALAAWFGRSCRMVWPPL